MSISAFVMGVAESIVANSVSKVISKANPLHAFPGYRYRKRITGKLMEMPFLFSDMNLNTRDDYVSLDVLSLQDGDIKAPSNTWSDHSGPMAKFEAFQRAIVFAGGGYGKTTLFRNIALQSLAKKPWERSFGARRIVPIYLQLKVVKNSSEFPIMEALQASDPYFNGEKGLRRIARLGRSRRLLLLLDGYDEMPYTGGFDHVRREIEFILQKQNINSGVGSLAGMSVYEKSKYFKAYGGIKSCRVYLSSRREFFDYHSIGTELDVQKWIVRGLEDRRIELVEKIFSKYRERTLSSSGRDLNSELFLQELSRLGDRSVNDLSKNPLFLTVMCYVYAMDASNGGSKVFSLGAAELSRVCIRLLLSDLDRYKSRDFSEADKKAVLNRRSAYVKEKYEFLAYFAVKLYEMDVPYFDENRVRGIAKAYFLNESNSSLAEEVLRGLDSDEPACNVVIQIIFSGLFVLVERQDQIRYFDFPHRRFREVLAVDYFDTDSRIDDLLRLIDVSSYSELILVFVEQSARRDMVLGRLIQRIVDTSGDRRMISLLVDAMGRVSVAESARLLDKLLVAVEDLPNVTLPIRVIDFFLRDSSTRSNIRAKLQAALAKESFGLTLRWCRIFSEVSPIEALNFVESECDHVEEFDVLRAIIFSHKEMRIGSPVVTRYVIASLKSKREDQMVSDVLHLFFIGRRPEDKELFRRWVDGLSLFPYEMSKSSEDLIRLEFLTREDSEKKDKVYPVLRAPRPAFE